MPTNPKEYYPPMHSAEHILNRTMIEMFNTKRSFSNHIERRKSKCDYYFDRNLTEEERNNLQNAINKTISLNLDITESILDFEDAKRNFELDGLPENHGDEIRIINIGNFDSCPCSGIHVKNSNEIGKIKIISSSFDNKVLRVRFKLQN